MSHDHEPAVESGIDEADSIVDARSAFVVLVVTVFSLLLFISNFDGALGLPGLL